MFTALRFPANYLLCQSEQDDPETPDVEYVELMEHGLTPFAVLFAEEENMQVTIANYIQRLSFVSFSIFVNRGEFTPCLDFSSDSYNVCVS